MTPEEYQKYIDEAANDGLPMAQALQSPQNKNPYYDWLIENGFTQNLLLNNEDLARMLKAFEGTDFWDRARMNPYLSFTRNHGALDDFMGLFGASSYDRAKDEQIQAAAEYFSRLQNEMDQQSYDTPVAQASRMAAAGQNADLLGTSGVSDSAKMDLPIVSPDLSQGPGLADFVNVVTSAASLALSMYGKFKEFKSVDLANDLQEAQIVDKINDTAQRFSSEAFGQFGSYNGTSVDFLPNPYKSRRDRKIFQEATDRVFATYRTLKEGRELKRDAIGAADDVAKSLSSKYHSDPYKPDDMNSDVFRGISVINDVTTELVAKVNQDMARLQRQQISNDMSYATTFDSALSAETANAQNKESKEAISMTNQLNASMREMTEKLYKDYKGGSKFAGFLLMALNVFRLVSVGVTSGNSLSDQGKFTQNHGFSFGFR